MKKEKVVTASEMARIEALTLSEGQSEQNFVLAAGSGIAQKIIDLSPSKKIVLLSGRGNNGADGFVAGSILLKKGYSVRSLLFFSPPSSFSKLCFTSFESFKQAGGTYVNAESLEDINFEKDETIVDSIFGTGFKGRVEAPLSLMFEKINSYKNLKIAIDIPSGINGNSGEIASLAIKADHTIYLSLAKTGLFLKNSWNWVGEIHQVDFGLKEKYISQAHASFLLAKAESIKQGDLPPIERTRNKYTAGFVVAIAGSPGMEGAANLSGKAALRSGAGIVKLFMYGFPHKTCVSTADELVKLELDLAKKEEVISTCNNASAIFIGPGIGRTQEISEFLRYILPKIITPLVLDADGLYFLSENPNCPLPKHTVITPHRKEMERLINKKNISIENLLEESQLFCKKKNVVIVLKGAPTFVLKEDQLPIIITAGDPGMATAGSGDVLTGIVTALISQKMDIYNASILGAVLHGIAGKSAAKEKTSYSMVASDIIDNLPQAFKKALTAKASYL